MRTVHLALSLSISRSETFPSEDEATTSSDITDSDRTTLLSPAVDAPTDADADVVSAVDVTRSSMASLAMLSDDDDDVDDEFDDVLSTVADAGMTGSESTASGSGSISCSATGPEAFSGTDCGDPGSESDFSFFVDGSPRETSGKNHYEIENCFSLI